jgi:hypothetical protein
MAYHRAARTARGICGGVGVALRAAIRRVNGGGQQRLSAYARRQSANGVIGNNDGENSAKMQLSALISENEKRKCGMASAWRRNGVGQWRC